MRLNLTEKHCKDTGYQFDFLMLTYVRGAIPIMRNPILGTPFEMSAKAHSLQNKASLAQGSLIFL